MKNNNGDISQSNLTNFTLKFAIAAIVIVGALSFILPDPQFFQSFKMAFDKRIKNDIGMRTRLKGLLTTNPAVHWKESVIEEGKGRFDEASIEMELAVGLLEMHSADKTVIERYSKRLNSLRAKALIQQSSSIN